VLQEGLAYTRQVHVVAVEVADVVDTAVVSMVVDQGSTSRRDPRQILENITKSRCPRSGNPRGASVSTAGCARRLHQASTSRRDPRQILKIFVKIPLQAKRALWESRRGEVEVGGQSPQAGTDLWRDSRCQMSAVSGGLCDCHTCSQAKACSLDCWPINGRG
jgi:hypothetical protein